MDAFFFSLFLCVVLLELIMSPVIRPAFKEFFRLSTIYILREEGLVSRNNRIIRLL